MINLSSVTSVLKDQIGEIRVYNASGLFYSKQVTQIENVTSTKYKIIVYFDETEANTFITQFKIFTKDGREVASVDYNKEKNQYQSLLIYWYMEVK
ncbi:MAG: hypothetical protein AB2462_08840 [Thermoanaerobacter sp.]|jgi:lipopolysaccharide export LptBFGC system permease protein LptF|uniref:hypothetical protein n=1 Tax=Thermoanaerobacter sp. TaxID=1755 RepID=UPI003463A72B